MTGVCDHRAYDGAQSYSRNSGLTLVSHLLECFLLRVLGPGVEGPLCPGPLLAGMRSHR